MTEGLLRREADTLVLCAPWHRWACDSSPRNWTNSVERAACITGSSSMGLRRTGGGSSLGLEGPSSKEASSLLGGLVGRGGRLYL